MLNNSDFRELLSLFIERKVRFLVVGGYAVMRYTEPRFTKDLDLWIAVDEANAASVFGALKAFGAPLTGLAAKDFMDRESFYQMGRPPLRVDVMMSIPGVEFDAAWSRREEVNLNGLVVPFIGKDDLIRAKLAAAREQDLSDAKRLQQQSGFGGREN